MRHRSLLSVLASLCMTLGAATAHAQIGSSCLRPLGIPDKWIENQTPPWDPTDTFDPTGSNPDVYYDGYVGFNPAEDQGRPMSLVLYDPASPLQGQSAWPIAVGESGFYEEIVACSGFLHMIGESFPRPNGSVIAPFGPAVGELIAQDPNATWDPAANVGQGGVINSAFAQSPRVIALPVFAPNTYAASTTTSPAMVKIVGFFVSERIRTSAGYAIHGYLTGWSQLATPPVTARFGEWAQLSATVTGPGSPIVGLPLEFLYDDTVVATAETDATGIARPATTSFLITATPGQYPGALRVRLREYSSFFVADEASAELTVLKKLPVITWLPLPNIVYGTPLGPLQLNAVADVPGEFSYTPAAGTVLPVHHEPVPLTATFVPAADESELYDQTTATTYVTVTPAPLTVRVNDASKLYLDPLPAFTVSAVGFVNGEGLSVLDVSPTFVTSATATSDVGTYGVLPAWISTANYEVTLQPGVLTIVPRPTVSVLQSSGPSPSTYGQAVSFTLVVSSGVGVPGGTVTLVSAGLAVATVPLVDGQASLNVSSLEAGNHALSARYSGSGGFAASSSPTLAHTVNAATTRTELTSSLNPSRVGQAVTFTAAVSPISPGAGSPAGSVEFLQGGVVIGTVPLAGGSAALTTAALPAGKHTIQARYLGTRNYLPSTSTVVQQSVRGGAK